MNKELALLMDSRKPMKNYHDPTKITSLGDLHKEMQKNDEEKQHLLAVVTVVTEPKRPNGVEDLMVRGLFATHVVCIMPNSPGRLVVANRAAEMGQTFDQKASAKRCHKQS